jgi:hypothetical protein
MIVLACVGSVLGCAQRTSLARKEKLPASLLQAVNDPRQKVEVRSVLRPEAERAMQGAPNGMNLAGGASPTVPPGMSAMSGTPPITDPSLSPAGSTGAGNSSMVDGRIQYASLTEPTPDAGSPPIPALPDSIPPTTNMARVPPSSPGLDRPSSLPTLGAHQAATEAARVDRMRQLAARIRQRMPDRLDDFMREVRQGAAQGNWDAVLASWEVDLEFGGSPPAEHRTSSLSDALRRDLPTSAREPTQASIENRDRLLQEPEPSARVTSVHTPLDVPSRADAPTLQASIASPGHERSVPYRSSQDVTIDDAPGRGGSAGVDFASFAEEMGSRSTRDASDPHQWKVYSRLLYAMAGERERALAPIEGMDPADRRFWRSYVYALDRYFDRDNRDRPATRATQASVALKESIDALAERADLEISEPIFCRAVHSFGNYEEFDRYEFRAGDGVVVYWEVRQFTSVESAEGYRTRMKAEFEVVDSQGNRRHRFEQKFKDDVCQRKRSDYFNVVVFEWPKDLAPGDYSLRVTVTDLQSQKIAERRQSLRITR